jgi:hypothetical protein
MYFTLEKAIEITNDLKLMNENEYGVIHLGSLTATLLNIYQQGLEQGYIDCKENKNVNDRNG